MKGRPATLVFSLVALAAIIAYDVFAWIHWGTDATISKTTLTLAPEHPAIPLFVGGLAAHLFLPGKTFVPAKAQLPLVVAVLVLAEIAALLMHFYTSPLITLALGFPMGRILFPQAPVEAPSEP